VIRSGHAEIVGRNENGWAFRLVAKAIALAQIFWVTPFDSSRLKPNPFSRTG
jgi:hypothetical protein